MYFTNAVSVNLACIAVTDTHNNAIHYSLNRTVSSFTVKYCRKSRLIEHTAKEHQVKYSWFALYNDTSRFIKESLEQMQLVKHQR